MTAERAPDLFGTGEPIDGMLVGRAHNLAEWQHRKERQAFDALCNRLNVRRWRKRIYAEGGAALDRLRAKNREKANAYHERQREKRKGRVFTCGHCGATWCVVPRAPGACWVAKACSPRCARALWKSENAEHVRRYKNASRGGGTCMDCGGEKPAGRGRRRCDACAARKAAA